MFTTGLLLLLATQTPFPIQLERAWVRGDDGDTLVSFSRLNAGMVGVGPDDRIYLLDISRQRIVVLDPEGRTLRPIGRQGQGPGELSAPAAVSVSPTGTLLVYDFARQGFSRWSPSRTPLSALPFSGPGIPNDPQALNDTLVYFATVRSDSVRLLRYTPEHATTIDAYPSRPWLSVGKNLCGLMEYRRPAVFAPSLVWSVWDSDVAVTYGPEPKIQVSSHVLTAPSKPRATTRQMAIDWLGPERTVASGQPPCKLPPERIIDAVGMERHLPAYQRLIPASASTLWALRFGLKGEPCVVDIFDKKTGYRRSVQLGAVSPIAFLHGGHLLSLETTEDDVPLIVAYRVPASLH